MSAPQQPSASQRPTPVVQIGTFKLTGVAAQLVILLIVAGIVTLIVRSHPTRASIPMFLSGAVWIAFMAYWSASARKAGKAERAESRDSRRVHEMILNAGILLIFIPVPGLTGRTLPPGALVAYGGVAAELAFLLLAVWARRTLGRNWSGAISTVEGHALVKSGPYRLIRHPIYTAIIGLAAATAVASGEWHAAIGFAVVSVAYARKIPMEEAHLVTLFGPAWSEYRRSTTLLVPFVL